MKGRAAPTSSLSPRSSPFILCPLLPVGPILQREAPGPECPPENSTEFLVWAEVPNPHRGPVSLFVVASGITGFTPWVYLNQPLTSDRFKNMLEVGVLHAEGEKTTHKQADEASFLPSCPPTPNSFSLLHHATSQSSFHSWAP